jgi:hypothetical protein
VAERDEVGRERLRLLLLLGGFGGGDRVFEGLARDRHLDELLLVHL